MQTLVNLAVEKPRYALLFLVIDPCLFIVWYRTMSGQEPGYMIALACVITTIVTFVMLACIVDPIIKRADETIERLLTYRD